MTEKREIDIKKVNEVAGILGNWLSHNVDWYKNKGIDLNDVIYHAFFTKNELLTHISHLEKSIKRGHVIIVYEKDEIEEVQKEEEKRRIQEAHEEPHTEPVTEYDQIFIKISTGGYNTLDIKQWKEFDIIERIRLMKEGRVTFLKDGTLMKSQTINY